MSINLVGNFSLSVFTHIRAKLIASGIGSGGVSGTYLDAYPDEDMMNRIITIDDIDTTGNENALVLPVLTFEEGPGPLMTPLGLGDKGVVNRQTFVVSIFADNAVQLRRLVGEVIHDIRQPIDLKDYNTNYNNPPTTGQLHVNVERIQTARIRSASPRKALRHNAEVIFEVEQ